YRTIQDCDFIIQPACAEGVPGGALETMKYGLIPVMSKESNIPEARELGSLLETSSLEEVKQALNFVTNLPTQELTRRAAATIKTIETSYTQDIFVDDVKKAVDQIV